MRGTTELSPPSTPIDCPVIHLFSGSSSHVIALATSSGVPGRPIACSWDEAASDVSDSQIFRVNFDLMRPGATAFTRIPRLAYVDAAERISPRIPAFAAAIAS